MSSAVVCSGPIIILCCDLAYSRLWSLDCWISKWCPKISDGFTDNLAIPEGNSYLLGHDGIHPTQEGHAPISCSIAKSLRTGLIGDDRLIGDDPEPGKAANKMVKTTVC